MKSHRLASSALFVVLALVLATGPGSVVEAVGYPFADDFESGLGNWSADPPWDATTAFYHSPAHSATDSPSTLYGASVDASLTLGSSVDLSSATRPVLRFWHRYQLEDGYDFGYVEVSTDGGVSWSTPEATVTGAVAEWVREQIDLAAYVGQSDVRVRFRLVTDGTVQQDGWYVDDVVITEGPAAEVLDTPVTVAPNSVDLTWSESSEVDFEAYRLYRSTSPGFDWNDAVLVAEIDDSSVTAYSDITVTPKSTFYYQLMVVTSNDLHSLSNEVDATTPAGMDYPFLDDGEGTGTAWSADPPWALTTEAAFSGSHSWSDSPGGDYGDSIASQALTLVGPIDLTSASTPVLSFIHTYDFLSGDSAHAEISTDGGSSWTSLINFTNGSSGGFLRERLDLSSYVGFNDVLVRFRITTDSANGADGWYVDDISLAESPTVVDPPILDQETSHSIRVSWARCNDLLFSHYAIHRSASSDVGIQDELVTEIHDQDTTTFTDTGLAVDTDYYYRVYAVNPYGTYSPDSVSASTTTTGGNPYPFAEDFEGSLEAWNLSGEWGKTASDKHGGSYSLTDSPETTYEVSSFGDVRTSIDLTGSVWPVLRFWDRYAFADGGDWGRVEVSANGSSWVKLYSATGTRVAWTEQMIDLSPWKNETNLRVRFVFSSNYTGVDDGWYIDDITIDEHVPLAIPFPFVEDFELGTGNWLTSSWGPWTDDPHGGALAVRSTPNGGIIDRSELSMELAGTLDLSGTTDPQLIYWIRGAVGDNGGFQAQVSIDGGASWSTVWSFGQYWSGDWTRVQVSLAAYRQSGVRLRLRATQGQYNGLSDIVLDDVAVEEMPEPVNLHALVPHLKSVELTWDASTLPDFDRYEVYRSTSANVTVGDTLIYSSTDAGDTAFTDTGLSIGATYFYRVFVFNSRSAATPSNERTTTTVPLSFPFADSMENLDSWDATGTWGPDGTDPYEGSFSLNDSPGDNSTPSQHSYILTAIDLSGSSWPVLRFFDRYGLVDDWAAVEVSTNGTSWTKVYSAYGSRLAWTGQAIDLSPWKTETNLRIRFSVWTNSANFDEGWYVDALSIGEHLDVGVTLPFADDLESGMGNWLMSSWAPWVDNPHGGAVAVRSTPNGAIVDRSELSMELAGTLDLSGTTDPQLVYWIRGAVGDNGGFQAQVSIDGGASWSTVWSFGQYWSGDWTRVQVSLAAYRQSGVRLRLRATQGQYTGLSDIVLDDFAIEEMPEPVNLHAPVPHLKSVDLTWDASTLPDFERYEVYRSTSANVTVGDTLIYSSTSSGDTAFTDTGLSIGATYYYRVFVYNTRSAATPSNERSTTTVPLSFPFADSMENLDSWDATGTWGPDGTDPYEGAFSLNDSPGNNSTPSQHSYILTAIDLSGSSWPVLRFFDRYGLVDDWAAVEVSPNGSTWTKVYSAYGSRLTWTQQAIDLSPWKTATNLRIRFSVWTNSANFDEGWYVDDLSIVDHSGAFSLPFVDDLESGTDNWLMSSWASWTDDPHGGTTAVRSTPNGAIVDRSELSMELAGTLDLSSTTNPQLVYWIRGAVGDNGGFQAQVSIDGGVTWSTTWSFGQYWSGGWTRVQVSLADYRQSEVRLRLRATQGQYTGLSDVVLDDIAIEELPQPVTLETPDQVTISSMRLSWNDLNEPTFAAYALYRSDSPTVDTGSDLVATLTEQTTTEFVDTGLQARKTYYYKVFFVDQANVYTPSNTASAVTLGVPLPFADDFESDSGVWTLTGEWGLIDTAGVGGSTSLGDSPGDLNQSTDTWAVTGVDLSGTTWPVLAFSDRYDVPHNHSGLLQISSNGGGGWTTLHAARGTQTEWVDRRFDLSPWRDQGQVWIRFRLAATSSTPADGWHIDNLSIGENPLAGSSGYPMFDGFEDGAGDWLAGPWTLTDDNPYEGEKAILDTADDRVGGSLLWLTFGRELDLSAASDPLLTLQVRGNTPDRNYFRGQVSTDGGLSWQNLPDIYIHDEQYWPDWTRMQTSLDGYLVANLRLRFQVDGSYGGDSNIFLDNIAVGEQTPGAPTLESPAWGADVETVRPVLTVTNAIDFQSDPMTYHYQVFDDAGLTNIVAEVPAVAGGIGTTSWTVDEDLLPDTQYWWRCRATDDTDHTGPWMDTATFFVQLEDHPPTVPVLLGPSDGAEVPDLSGRLTWLESTDPDEDNGDYVAGYRVQVDDDPNFGSAEIDVEDLTLAGDAPALLAPNASGAISVMLSELAGSGDMVLGTLYYWRVNAKDSHGVSSDWSAGPASFVFGTDQQAPSCAISSPADDATLTDLPIVISGSATDDLSGIDFVEVSTDGGTSWTEAVGDESWSHQWWPALSGDYELTCRATDVSGNLGAAAPSITVHADLERTLEFPTTATSGDESMGTYNVSVTLSGPRAVEVAVGLQISGSAVSGVDYETLPETLRFYPGQTTLVFPVTVIDDVQNEGQETLVIELVNPNLTDVLIAGDGRFTLTIVDNDAPRPPDVLEDGFEDGNLEKWSNTVQ